MCSLGGQAKLKKSLYMLLFCARSILHPHANKQCYSHLISPFSRLSTPALQHLRSACTTEVIYRAVVVCSQSTTASHSNDYWFGLQTTTGLHPIPVVVCTSTTTPLRWSLLSPVTLPTPKNAFPPPIGGRRYYVPLQRKGRHKKPFPRQRMVRSAL